jgi:DMSO/TMAO reductase YedYZ heme-binding membrane subunit
MVLKRELTFFVLVIIFGLAISLFVFFSAEENIAPLTLTIRLLALNGYFALSVAAIMTPFLKEVTLFFKKSFTKVHHYFAATGLLFITLHPLAVFTQNLDPTVFLPNFKSFYLFFFFGGIVALLLIYVAFGTVLVRRKIPSYWRPFHMLMYLALFIGVVHANLRGSNFQSLSIQILYDSLFAAALAAFILKRWKFYRLKTRVNNHTLMSSNNNKA